MNFTSRIAAEKWCEIIGLFSTLWHFQLLRWGQCQCWRC